MSVKINVKQELGIAKSIEVKESNKNIRKTWLFQRLMTKFQIEQEMADKENKAPKDDDQEPKNVDPIAEMEKSEKMIDSMLTMQEKVIDYITDILNLNDKQSDKLDDMEFGESFAFAMRISSELLHVDMEEETESDKGLED